MIRNASKKISIGILFFICLSYTLHAQSIDKEPLATILKKIELKHDVRFSFASETIKYLKVKAPDENLTLVEILDFLEKQLPFQIKKISDRYYSLLKDTSSLYCIQIIASNTNKPLDGATVLETNSTYGTTTDDQGFFYIKKDSGLRSFSVQFIGFETLSINTSQFSESCTIFYMTTETTALETVIVKSYLTKGISRQNTSAISINSNNFGLVPGQVENDVLQIAQVLPGIESVDETISNINIRAGTHAENLIMWEDIKMYQSGHFFGLISAFNPALTNNVSIYKNGTPIRYGQGVSGVIDMRSNNEIPRVTKAAIGLNLINASGNITTALSDKIGIQVAARTSLNSVFESPVYSSYSERIFQDSEIDTETEENAPIVADEDFKFYDLSGKMIWKPSENDKLVFDILTIDDQLDYTETITANNENKTSTLDQRSLAIGLNWTHNWNAKHETYVLGYLSYYLLNAENKDINTTQVLTQENEVIENGAKFESKLLLNDFFTFINGYHFNETGIANTQDVNLPRFRDFEKNVIRTHSAFSGVHYLSENKKTNVQIGVRANYFTKFKEMVIEPRVQFKQQFGPGFFVEVLGEFKSQTTTQRIDFESDFLGVEKRRWVLADGENIPITKSKQVSLATGFENQGWLVSLEGFYKKVTGISTINQGFQNQFQFVREQGSYSAKGVEAVINKRTNIIDIWLSYSVLNADYSFNNLTPSTFPSNLDIRHHATLASSYYHNNLKLSMGINWNSGKPYTLPLLSNEQSDNLEDPILYDLPNTERLPHYFRTDFSAEYNFDVSTKISGKLNFALLNIFNSENILNIRYAKLQETNNGNSIKEIRETSLGITPNASFQLFF